jgi:hypothetical protein
MIIQSSHTPQGIKLVLITYIIYDIWIINNTVTYRYSIEFSIKNHR